MVSYERLQALMESRNLKKAAFAQAIGISQGNLNDWRNGRSSPSVEKLERIADYFGVSTDFLLGRDDRYPVPTEDACEVLRIFSDLDREGRTVVLSAAYTEKRRCSGMEVSEDSSMQ